LSTILSTHTGSLRREALYWHYPHYSNQGGTSAGAIRAGDYKLIEFYEDGRLELYHLGRDIGEGVNLATRDRARAARMREMLERWRRSVDARMPSQNPKFDASTADQGLTGANQPPVKR